MSWSTSKHRGSTRASRTLRAQVLTDHPYCYLRYAGCTIHSTEDDHVIPLHIGGSDEPSNHRGVCHTCHMIKTQHEAQAARSIKPGRRRPTEPHPGLR